MPFLASCMLENAWWLHMHDACPEHCRQCYVQSNLRLGLEHNLACLTALGWCKSCPTVHMMVRSAASILSWQLPCVYCN